MAAVEDLLTTRLQVAGLSGYARSFKQAAGALGIFSRELEDAEKAELAIGIAAGAASLAIVAGLGRATLAAGEHEAILQRVSLSFGQFGHAVPQSALEDFGNRLQDTTAIARDQSIALAGLFAEYGLGEQQAEQLTKSTLNAAEALKARGLSAESVASRIGIALERARMGDTAAFSRLSQIGIVVNRARAAADPFGAVIDALNRKGGQQAEMFRKTLPGSIDAFRNSLLRLGQDVGAVMAGPLTGLVNLGTRLLDLLDRFPVAMAAVAGAAAVGFGASAIGRVLPIVRGLGAAVAGAAGAAGAGGLAAKLMAANPGLSAEAAATMAAGLGGGAAGAAAGGAGIGLGARALGFLRGPGGIGLAAGTAFGLAGQPFANRNDPAGQFGFMATRAVAGAGYGAAVGSAIPGLGTAAGAGLGALAGVAEALIEKWMQRGGAGQQQQEARDATDSLTKSNEDLRAAINGLNQKLDQFVGNSDIRDVLGDSRLVAAFARGIA